MFIVARRIRSGDLIFALGDLFLKHGLPNNIKSYNDLKFIAKKLKQSLLKLELQPLYIDPGSPCKNGYIESLMGSEI